ncbi:MAG: signal transduction histidine kinase [Pseudoalteromonas tetraodonis]
MKFFRLRSLNARLLLAILASMIVALAVGGTVIHELFKKRLLDDFDAALRTDLSFHVVSCIQVGHRPKLGMTTMEMRRHRDTQNPVFAQYRFASDARHFHYSRNLKEHSLPQVGFASDEPASRDITLFDGKPARAMGVEFTPEYYPPAPGDKDATEAIGPIRMHVVVAKELTSVYDSLKKLRHLLYQVAFGMTVLLIASTSLILWTNLQPLKELSRQIGEAPVTGANHFKLKGAPAELDPVVRRLNLLIDRVEGAFERERHFTANAAHELRNPLAGMRSQIELSLGLERSPEEYRHTLESIYDIQQGMERVVENLLILARLESGEETAKQEIVPITEVLRRGWRKVYDAAEQKELQVSWDIQSEMPPLVTARNLVSITVRNLLDNAVDYSPRGGSVKISAHYDRLIASATIRVSNENTNLTADDCEKMFELFWRGDQPEDSHHHSGLGLGLCRRIVRILHGELKVRLLEGDRLVEFVCTFPCQILEAKISEEDAASPDQH